MSVITSGQNPLADRPATPTVQVEYCPRCNQPYPCGMMSCDGEETEQRDIPSDQIRNPPIPTAATV